MVAWKPHAVSFSSGGVWTVGQFGVLTALLESDTNVLSNVSEWYGCSGGSISAFFGAIGVSPSWIRTCAEHIRMDAMMNIQDELIVDYTNHWGIDSGESLIEYLGKLIDTWEPGASAWTFADFARERPRVKRLGIITTNVSQGKQVVCCLENTPNMRILDAIRASSSIPLFYTPWRDEAGDYFCDGAVVETYPWDCVTDKYRTLVIVCNDNQIAKKRRTSPGPITSLSDYISGIVQFVLRLRNPTSENMPRFWIAVNDKTLAAIDFQAPKEAFMELFHQGVSSGNAWLAFRQKSADVKNPGTPPLCGDHCTSACCPPPSGDKMSDNHQSGSLLQASPLFRDLRKPSGPSGRRWSL